MELKLVERRNAMFEVPGGHDYLNIYRTDLAPEDGNNLGVPAGATKQQFIDKWDHFDRDDYGIADVIRRTTYKRQEFGWWCPTKGGREADLLRYWTWVPVKTVYYERRRDGWYPEESKS